MKLPTLYTERLIIRPLSVLDADDMFEYAKTPHVGPMAGWPPHISIVETISIIKSMITIKSPYELGNWAIVLKSNNKMIGTIELYNHYYKFKAELGYSINPMKIIKPELDVDEYVYTGEVINPLNLTGDISKLLSVSLNDSNPINVGEYTYTISFNEENVESINN